MTCHLITEGQASDNTPVFNSPLYILTKHDSLRNNQYHLPITDYTDINLKPNPEAWQDQAICSAHIHWRKKNAFFFSINCNVFIFNIKKIMLTPKQPVINAVLITYIDYSITENYIGNMASFLPYTHPEPLLKVLHHIY